MSHQEVLAERYGGRSSGRRRAVLAGSVLVAVAFLGWLAWAIWANVDPEVTSQMPSFDVRDDHSVTATLQVRAQPDATDVTCALTAVAIDHSVVGEVRFRPDPGAGEQQVTIRTDRRATSVQFAGCTADGQDRPR